MIRFMSEQRYQRLKENYNRMRDNYRYVKQLADEGQVDQGTITVLTIDNLNQKQEIKNLNNALVRKDYSNRKLVERVNTLKELVDEMQKIIDNQVKIIDGIKQDEEAEEAAVKPKIYKKSILRSAAKKKRK